MYTFIDEMKRLPDASVEPEHVADDIVQLGDRGAGGVEFLPYYSYGGTQVWIFSTYTLHSDI
jgi:hypothetical protein